MKGRKKNNHIRHAIGSPIKWKPMTKISNLSFLDFQCTNFLRRDRIISTAKKTRTTQRNCRFTSLGTICRCIRCSGRRAFSIVPTTRWSRNHTAALSSEIILKSLSFFFFSRNDFELVHTSVECSEESNRSLD